MLNIRTMQLTRSGFYPILIIGLCACYVFYKLLLQTYPSVITGELMSEFKLSAAGLGNLAATFYYTYMITQLFVGCILDRYGVRWLTTFAIFNCALGIFIFSQTHTLLTAELARALMGIGVSFATVAYMKLAAVWFHPRHYAFVNGLLATAAMAGAVFGEAPLSWLVHDYGWRHSLALIGIMGFVLTFLFLCSVTDKSPQTGEAAPDVTFKEIAQIFKIKQNWLLTLYGGFAFCPIAVFGGLWGTPFLEAAYHLPKIEAASLLSLIFIGFGIGSPLLGIVSDRLKNRRHVMIVGTLISCISLSLIMYFPLPMKLLETAMFLFGFGLGAYMLVFTIGKEINRLCLMASVIAMINASDALLDGFTEPLIGKFLDLCWNGKIVNGVHLFTLQNYHAALLILPVYLAAAVLTLAWIKEPEHEYPSS